MPKRSLIEELLARDEVVRPRWARGPGPDGVFNLIAKLPIEVLRFIDNMVRDIPRYFWYGSAGRYIGMTPGRGVGQPGRPFIEHRRFRQWGDWLPRPWAEDFEMQGLYKLYYGVELPPRSHLSDLPDDRWEIRFPWTKRLT